MTEGPRLSSRHRWYYLDLKFVLDHVPQVLGPQGCTHDPCQPPVVPILVVDPRGRGRPRITNDQARGILATGILAVYRVNKHVPQAAVLAHTRWPSSRYRLTQGASARLCELEGHGAGRVPDDEVSLLYVRKFPKLL
jgi:hypothetical protein